MAASQRSSIAETIAFDGTDRQLPAEASGSCPREPGPVDADREAQSDDSEPKRNQRRGIKGNDGQAQAECTYGGGQYDETLSLGYVHFTPRQSPEKPYGHHH